MQTAKVAHIMLDSGNDKLNEAMKQLVMSEHAERSYKPSWWKHKGTIREMTMKRSNTDEEPAGPSATKT